MARVHRPVRVGDLVINFRQRTVMRGMGLLLPITHNEFELLKMLAERKGETLTTEALFYGLYGHKPYDEWPELTVIYTTMTNLRKKLDLTDLQRYIKAVYAIGYRLEDPG